MAKRIKVEEWLGSENEDEMEYSGFDKKINNHKNERERMELQKSYKGDSRFKLHESFKDDIDFERLPEVVKGEFPVPSTHIPEEHNTNEYDFEGEKFLESQILRSLHPETKFSNGICKVDHLRKESFLLKRFDPTRDKPLPTLKEAEPKISAKSKKTAGISAGIDKKSLKIKRANEILKAPQKEIPYKEKVKKINYTAWENLIKEKPENCKLFS